MLFYHWKPSVQTRDWNFYEHRPTLKLGKPLSIFCESKYVQQLISKGSPRGYKFYGPSRFIDSLCTINNHG